MRALRNRFRRLKRNERGAAIVEFALVIPFFFLLVWGGLIFSRSYQRLGVLKGALREGARKAAAYDSISYKNGNFVADQTKKRISDYTSAFGFASFDTSVVQVSNPYFDLTGEVTVSVTDYKLFSDLTGWFAIDSMNVSDAAVFRWERSPP